MCRHNAVLDTQGRIASWIFDKVGLDPASLQPSVRAGLEGAVLTALADAQGVTLHALLMSAVGRHNQISGAMPSSILVNGLLECNGSMEECVREACQLVAQGYAALKLKVRLSPRTWSTSSCRL